MTEPVMVYKFIRDYDFEGKAGDLLKVMQEIIADHGADCDVHTSEDGGIEVYKKRPETEAETKARLAVVDRQKEYRRSQYEKLREEFEAEYNKKNAGVLGYNDTSMLDKAS